MQRLILSILFLFSISGCATVEETAKTVWGSSTRALEKVRDKAIKKTFSCTYDQCFDAVIAFADKESEIDDAGIQITGMSKKPEPTPGQDPNHPADDADKKKSLKRKNFDIFIKDRLRQRVVVMNVPGAVNTTEVGIFFTVVEGKGTEIEVTSLSTSAKVKVSDMLFTELEATFKEVN